MFCFCLFHERANDPPPENQWLEEYDEVWEKRVRLGKGAAAREPDKVRRITPATHIRGAITSSLQVQPKKVARVELPPMPPAEAKKCLSEVSFPPASDCAAVSHV